MTEIEELKEKVTALEVQVQGLTIEKISKEVIRQISLDIERMSRDKYKCKALVPDAELEMEVYPIKKVVI